MGISGLLPYLKNASRPTNIKEFKGCTVAVDSYCWLHKGTFSCADKLVMGEQTDQYVYYCMKYVRNLLSMGIRPIMVFDGCSLPSKKEVEKQRRERREINKKKAADLLREGRRAEARDAFRMCIDITSEMALNLMKACREIGVDCIVAPYEADAQLAYLNKIGVAQIIITEDSDLLLFGCERVMFKMDIAGNGVLVEQVSINKALGLKADCYSFEKFRHICILSGCDYLASLPGIGLKKATLLFQRTRQPDMNVVIKKIPTTLNMKTLTVTPAYIEGFFRADNTFLYQLVFDPTKRKLVPLNPYPEGMDQSDFIYAGPYLPKDLAYQLALGNLSVHNMQPIYDFDPDNFQPKSRPNYSKGSKDMLQCLSIWDRNYRPPPQIAYTQRNNQTNLEPERKSTLGKEVLVNVKTWKTETANVKSTNVKSTNVKSTNVKSTNVKSTNVKHSSPLKRHREEEEQSTSDLLSLYSSPSNNTHTTSSSQQVKRRKSEPYLTENKNPEDNQVLSDLADLLDQSENDDSIQKVKSEECFEDGHNTSSESHKLNDSREERKKSVNKFKVTKELPRARLDLNIKSAIKVEVTSRYFSASKPTKRSTFLDSMKEKCENTSPPAEPLVLQSQDIDSTKGDSDNTTANSASDAESNRSQIDTKPNATSATKFPCGLFTFKSKLNSFKSDFDKKPNALQSRDSEHLGKSSFSQDCSQDSSASVSQSVIDMSSQNDTFPTGNSQSDTFPSGHSLSQRDSLPGSIDVDSFGFTQGSSQASVDCQSQEDVMATQSISQKNILSVLEKERKGDVSLGHNQQFNEKKRPLFHLGDGDNVKAESNEPKTEDTTPQSSQSSTTMSRCKSLGLSKSASTTPVSGHSLKQTLGGNCRSTGLKRRVSSKTDTENQTSIKSFFSKHFAYNKGNKDILERRKPLSPTKGNILNT